MAIERREEMVGYVRRGEESESDVDVGVPMEVRLHRFKKRQNVGRKTGKNGGLVRRGEESESDVCCRGAFGGKAPPLQETLKWW